MKKVIFMGKSGCGKTSLCQKLAGEDIKYKKTQSVEIFNYSIDTPGEYLENRFYYSALIITAADAEIVAFVQEYGDVETRLPPSFSGAFGRDVIGIITKIDKNNNDEVKDIIRSQIFSAGATRIFEVSAYTGEGIKDLKTYLNI